MHTQQWNPYFISIKCQCVGLWKCMDWNIIFMVLLVYNRPKLEPFCFCSYAQRDGRLHVVSTVAQSGQTTLLLERAFCLFGGHRRGGWDERWSFGCNLQPHSSMILVPLHWSFFKKKISKPNRKLIQCSIYHIASGDNLSWYKIDTKDRCLCLLICKLLCMLYTYSYNLIVSLFV